MASDTNFEPDLALEDSHEFEENGTYQDPEGVWVRQGPDDVEGMGDSDGLPVPAADFDDVDDPFAGEDQLSADELANLDDQFDLVEASPQPMEGESMDDIASPDLEMDDISSPDLEMDQELSASPSQDDAQNMDMDQFDEVDLDDFVNFDEDEDPSGGLKEEGAEVGTQSPPLPSETDEQEEFLDIDIDIDDEVPDSELEIYEDAKDQAVDEISLDEFLGEEEDTEEVDINDFGDFDVEDISEQDMGLDSTPEASSSPDQSSSTPEMDEVSLEDFTDSDDSQEISMDEPESDSEESADEESLDISDDTEIAGIEDAVDLDLDLDLDSDFDLDDDEEIEVNLGEEEIPVDESDSDEELVDTDEYFEELNLPKEENSTEEDSMEMDSPDEDSFEEESSDPISPEEGDFSDDFEQTLSMEKEEDPLPEDYHDREINLDSDAEEPDMDSIMALEEDLTAGIKEKLEEAKTASPTRSDEILAKIEQELSSIKSEIGDLKREITGMKSITPAETTPEMPDESSTKGFFDDDEDETIALTGDELDNILTTADVMEADVEGLEDQSDEPLISTDSEGNVLDGSVDDEEGIPSTDEELFAGTDLEDSLEDESSIPEIATNQPIPGGEGWDDPLDFEDGESDEDPEDTDSIPEEIELVDTGESTEENVPETEEEISDGVVSEDPAEPEDVAAPLQEDESIETEDLLGSEEEEGLDVSTDSLPNMEEFEEEAGELPEIDSQDIDFEESNLDIENVDLDSEFEMDESFGEGPVSIEDDDSESLEIPFDEDISLEEDETQAPEALEESVPSEEPAFPTIEEETDELNLPEQDGDDFESLDDELDREMAEMPSDFEAADSHPEPVVEEAPSVAEPLPVKEQGDELPMELATPKKGEIPDTLRTEIKHVLKYMDNLLDSLPEDKIQEFAESEHFEVYKKLFEDLGLMD